MKILINPLGTQLDFIELKKTVDIAPSEVGATFEMYVSVRSLR